MTTASATTKPGTRGWLAEPLVATALVLAVLAAGFAAWSGWSRYQGTKIRNGLDTSPGPPLNTSARCTSPASSGIDVRGSAHAPGPAASSPMAGLLGLSP